MKLKIPFLATSLGLLLSAGTLAAQQAPVATFDTLRATVGSRIVAGAASTTRAVDVITRAEIERLPARNASDVIARALGVDLQPRSAAQADVSIRGSSYEQVMVLVDGVPVNDDQTGHFHLDLAVPLDAIERVEVLRGPAAALYGSTAVGGVINIVTRRAGAPHSARVQGGSDGAFAIAADVHPHIDLGLTGGRLINLHISAEHDRSDGHRPGTDHEATQARLAVNTAAGPGTLEADVAYAMRDFGANGFYANADSYEETRTATAALGWHTDGVEWSWAPRVSFRQHDDDFILRRDDPSFYRNQHTTRRVAGELIARWTPDPRSRVAFGADYARSAIDSRRLGDRAENTAAAFAEFALGEPDASLFSAGVRVDRHSTFGTFVSPSVAAGYRIAPAARIRASAGTGFRAPTWTERYYQDPANIGNPDLDAERFWTGELGVDAQLGPRLDISVTGFLRQSDELVDWARPDGASPTAPWRTTNVESATFRGLETQAHLALPADARLTARASLIGFDAEEASGLTSKYALRPLTRALSLEAGAPLGDVLQASVRGSHQRRAGAGDIAAEEWTLLDARLSARIRGVQLFADVTNILDEEYLDVSVRPAPGRAFSLGARVGR